MSFEECPFREYQAFNSGGAILMTGSTIFPTDKETIMNVYFQSPTNGLLITTLVF